MSVRETILRYHLIISKLRKHPLTFNELSDELARESEFRKYNLKTGKRTFQRDLETIRSIYSIDIQYDFKRGVYYYDPDENSESDLRMVEALDLFNALKISENISGVIHFEKRRPLGTENLNGLLHAIRNRVQVEVTYFKYWEDQSSQRVVEPYALKEFRNRWYLLAVDHKDQKMKVFGLDRLSNPTITIRKFRYPRSFDVNDFFSDCYGIIVPEGEKPEEVILSFEPHEGKYIKSLPLHSSQEIITDNGEELRIRLHLYITEDFIMEILSHGLKVKVIQPSGLIKIIRTTCQEATLQYPEE
jgi:predicted DNA-binding transcriptional regulator YafY